MPINSFSPPRIVIDTNSPVHAESSPHVRRTLDINRESDIHAVAGTPQTPISIHALRKESDPGTLRLTKRSKNFNPHSPCGERPSPPAPSTRRANFNPHSPCGERQYAYRHPSVKVEISIHTPLAGSDEAGAAVLVKADVISIHTPLAGSDSLLCGRYQYNKFQSTLPLRGATTSTPKFTLRVIFQSTLPLRGATRRQGTTY